LKYVVSFDKKAQKELSELDKKYQILILSKYVILPFDEYKKIEEMLEDYEDLIDLREAIKSSQRDFVTLEDLKKSLDIS